MKQGIKISIVSVVYNASDTIEDMIKSVIAQDYSNFEFIIMDGGSVDGTVDIIKKYSSQITYWQSERDNGIYDAMNKAIMYVSGDYLQFIGADDFFVDSSVISRVIEEIEPDTDLFSTCVTYVDENTGSEVTPGHFVTKFGHLSFRWIQHGGLYVKTILMKKYMFDERYKVAADFKFILQCLQDNCKVQYSEVVSIYFSQSGVSSRSYDDICKLENIQISNELHLDLQYKTQTFWKVYLNKWGILPFIKNMKEKMCNGRKQHTCNNSWCRWCRR